MATLAPGHAKPSEILDLGTLGGTSSFTRAMNAHGHVAGDSDIPGDAAIHAFLWTAGGTDGVVGNPQMKDLGTLGGKTQTVAINAHGEVIGGSLSPDGGSRTFLWTHREAPQARMIELTLGGSLSYPFDIDDGRVVGDSSLPGDPRGPDGRVILHAFLWTPGGTDGPAGNPQMKDLGTLGGAISWATAINAKGQVTGVSYVPGDSTSHAFLWTPAGTDGVAGNPQMKDLGTLAGDPKHGNSPGGPSSQALAINDKGQVAGYSDTGVGAQSHAFLWTPGRTDGVPTNPQMRDLGSLGGGWSQAPMRSLNAAGHVIGDTVRTDLSRAAFLWTPEGADGPAGNPQMRDLGTLGGPSTSAKSLDDGDHVTGASCFSADLNKQHAFLWTPTGKDGVPENPRMKDLGTLGGSSCAVAINCRGQVAGYSYLPDNVTCHAVLFTKAPRGE